MLAVSLVFLLAAGLGVIAFVVCFCTRPGPPATFVVLNCLRCRYNLVGLPRKGLCPECGAHYDKSMTLVRAGWRFAPDRALVLLLNVGIVVGLLALAEGIERAQFQRAMRDPAFAAWVLLPAGADLSLAQMGATMRNFLRFGDEFRQTSVYVQTVAVPYFLAMILLCYRRGSLFSGAAALLGGISLAASLWFVGLETIRGGIGVQRTFVGSAPWLAMVAILVGGSALVFPVRWLGRWVIPHIGLRGNHLHPSIGDA